MYPKKAKTATKSLPNRKQNRYIENPLNLNEAHGNKHCILRTAPHRQCYCGGQPATAEAESNVEREKICAEFTQQPKQADEKGEEKKSLIALSKSTNARAHSLRQEIIWCVCD